MRALAMAVVVAAAGGCSILDAAFHDVSEGVSLPSCVSDGSDFRIVAFTSQVTGQVDGLAFGDFNGDDRMDLLLVGSPTAVLYGGAVDGLGMGDAMLGAAAESPGGGMVKDIAVADINGDGADDVVLLMTGPNRIVTYGGQAGNALNSAATNTMFSVTAFDLIQLDTGPPALALVGGSDSENLKVLKWSDAITDYEVVTRSSALTEPQSIAVGDMNGDGRDDVAYAHTEGIGSAVQMGNGGNVSFGGPAAFVQKGNAPFAQVLLGHAETSDDRDDFYALTVGDADSGRSAELYRQPTMPTDGPPLLMKARVPFDVRGLARLGDWNNDGLDDLILPGLDRQDNLANLLILLAGGDGFQCAREMSLFITAGALAETRFVDAADVDGDGKTDLAVVDMNSNVMLVMGQ